MWLGKYWPFGQEAKNGVTVARFAVQTRMNYRQRMVRVQGENAFAVLPGNSRYFPDVGCNYISPVRQPPEAIRA